MTKHGIDDQSNHLQIEYIPNPVLHEVIHSLARNSDAGKMNTVPMRKYPISVVAEPGDSGEMREMFISPLFQSHLPSDLSHAERVDPVVVAVQSDRLMVRSDRCGE